MRKRVYTEEHINFLLENYKGISTKELTKLFNLEFNLNFTERQVLNFKSKRKLKSGYDRSNWDPRHKPVGTETLIANGYIMVKTAEPNQWEYKHKLVWEKSNGPVPDNHFLIFLDNNQQNCALENLAVVDAGTHGHMFKNGYYTTDGELTKSAIAVSKLLSKIKEVEEMENEKIKKADIKELRDSITLNDEEIKDIQSAVGTVSWRLTKEYFGGRSVSNDLFVAKLGHLRTGVYYHLKKTFEVGRYTRIKRIDFKKAMNKLTSFGLSDLEEYQTRLTPRQKEIAALNDDDISGLR